jgi:hypothetical protein
VALKFTILIITNIMTSTLTILTVIQRDAALHTTPHYRFTIIVTREYHDRYSQHLSLIPKDHKRRSSTQ